MRGTESQILHVRNLLMEYGWDDYDAPEFESQKKKDKKKALKEKLLQDMKDEDKPETDNETKALEDAGPKLKSKGTLKIRLQGLNFDQFQNSKTASNVTLKEIAKALSIIEEINKLIKMITRKSE